METQPIAPRSNPEPLWSEANVHEVCSWACATFGDLIICYVAACHQRDAARLTQMTRELRRMVTKLEAYRRRKVHQWAEVKR